MCASQVRRQRLVGFVTMSIQSWAYLVLLARDCALLVSSDAYLQHSMTASSVSLPCCMLAAEVLLNFVGAAAAACKLLFTLHTFQCISTLQGVRSVTDTPLTDSRACSRGDMLAADLVFGLPPACQAWHLPSAQGCSSDCVVSAWQGTSATSKGSPGYLNKVKCRWAC